MSFVRRWFKREQQGIIVPSYDIKIGETAEIKFDQYIQAYLDDAAIKTAVDFLVDQIVGPGYYITGDEKSVKAVEDFLNSNSFYNLLHEITLEVIIAGNSFIELVEPKKIEQLHLLKLSSVRRVKRDVYGRVKSYVLNVGGREKEIKAERIVHFKYNAVDNSAFGVGVLRPLLASRVDPNGNTVPSLLEIKTQTINDIRQIIHRYLPRYIYKFKGKSDTKVQEYATTLKNLAPTQDFYTNEDVEVAEVKMDPRAKFAEWLEFLNNEVLAALQTPVVKLFTTPGFTEASARAAVEAAERKVRTLQEFLRRNIENEILKPYCDQNNLKYVNFNWGQPDIPELDFDQIIKAAEIGVITFSEAKNMLRRLGWEIPEKGEEGNV